MHKERWAPIQTHLNNRKLDTHVQRPARFDMAAHIHTSMHNNGFECLYTAFLPIVLRAANLICEKH